VTDLDLIRELADLHKTAIATSMSADRSARDAYVEIADNLHYLMTSIAEFGGSDVLKDQALQWRDACDPYEEPGRSIFVAWAGHLEALADG